MGDDTPDGVREDATAETDDGSTATADDEPPTCSLTPEQAVERLEWAAETLEADLRDLRVADDRLVWAFDRSEQAIEGVTTLAEREAACCSFATITVTIPPEGPITFRMDVPEGSADALVAQFEDVADPRELV